jgi:hypothetical protein
VVGSGSFGVPAVLRILDWMNLHPDRLMFGTSKTVLRLGVDQLWSLEIPADRLKEAVKTVPFVWHMSSPSFPVFG